MATGTKKGTAITASRVSISASCTRPPTQSCASPTLPRDRAGTTNLLLVEDYLSRTNISASEPSSPAPAAAGGLSRSSANKARERPRGTPLASQMNRQACAHILDQSHRLFCA
jgi:hypothetical protein